MKPVRNASQTLHMPTNSSWLMPCRACRARMRAAYSSTGDSKTGAAATSGKARG